MSGYMDGWMDAMDAMTATGAMDAMTATGAMDAIDAMYVMYVI